MYCRTINVALTWAGNGLIILCNTRTLATDKRTWVIYMDWAKEHDLIRVAHICYSIEDQREGSQVDSWHQAEVGDSPRLKLLLHRMRVSSLNDLRESVVHFLTRGIKPRSGILPDWIYCHIDAILSCVTLFFFIHFILFYFFMHRLAYKVLHNRCEALDYAPPGIQGVT